MGNPAANKFPQWYAGYGANIEHEVVGALLGRSPVFTPVTVEGFELVVLSREDIRTLNPTYENFPDNFKLYTVRRKKGSAVSMMLWRLTNQTQRRALDTFSFSGLVSKPSFVPNEDRPFFIETIDDPSVGTIAEGKDYDPYLNGREATIHAAEIVHADIFGASSRERK